jgi:hypothetical protein
MVTQFLWRERIKDKVVSTGFDLAPVLSRSMREGTRGFEIMNFFGSGSGK